MRLTECILQEEVSRLRKEMQETIDYARAKHDEDPERSQLSPRSAEAHLERGGSAAYACAKGYARRRIQEKKQVVIPREGLAQSTENNSSSRVKKTPRTGGRTPRQSRDGEVGKEASQRKARKAAQLLEQPVLSSQAEVRGTAEDGSGGSIAAAVGESQSKTVAGGKEEGIVSTGQKNAEDTAKEQDKKAGGERARI